MNTLDRDANPDDSPFQWKREWDGGWVSLHDGLGVTCIVHRERSDGLVVDLKLAISTDIDTPQLREFDRKNTNPYFDPFLYLKTSEEVDSFVKNSYKEYVAYHQNVLDKFRPEDKFSTAIVEAAA